MGAGAWKKYWTGTGVDWNEIFGDARRWV